MKSRSSVLILSIFCILTLSLGLGSFLLQEAQENTARASSEPRATDGVYKETTKTIESDAQKVSLKAKPIKPAIKESPKTSTMARANEEETPGKNRPKISILSKRLNGQNALIVLNGTVITKTLSSPLALVVRETDTLSFGSYLGSTFNQEHAGQLYLSETPVKSKTLTFSESHSQFSVTMTLKRWRNYTATILDQRAKRQSASFNFYLNDEQSIELGDLHLESDQKVSGQVHVASSGAPINNCAVLIVSGLSKSFLEQQNTLFGEPVTPDLTRFLEVVNGRLLSKLTSTNHKGRFEFTMPNPGENAYSLVLVHPKHRLKILSLTGEQALDSLNIGLDPLGEIQIQVLTNSGAVVKDCTATLSTRPVIQFHSTPSKKYRGAIDSKESGGNLSAMTDSRGQLVFQSLSHETYQYYISAPGFSPKSGSLKLSNSIQKMTLKPAASIEVTVVDSSGEPQEAQIKLSSAHSGLYIGTANSLGHYQFKDLQSGFYLVNAYYKGLFASRICKTSHEKSLFLKLTLDKFAEFTIQSINCPNCQSPSNHQLYRWSRDFQPNPSSTRAPSASSFLLADRFHSIKRKNGLWSVPMSPNGDILAIQCDASPSTYCVSIKPNREKSQKLSMPMTLPLDIELLGTKKTEDTVKVSLYQKTRIDDLDLWCLALTFPQNVFQTLRIESVYPGQYLILITNSRNQVIGSKRLVLSDSTNHWKIDLSQ